MKKEFYLSESNGRSRIKVINKLKNNELEEQVSEFDNDLQFYKIYKEEVLKSDICYCFVDINQNGKVILKTKDGNSIIVESIQSIELKKYIDNSLSRKMYSSFEKMFSDIVAKQYKYIVLTTQKGKYEFNDSISYKLKDDSNTIFIQLPTDKEDKLTTLSRKMLDFITEEELIKWNYSFVVNSLVQKTTICYDDKIMIINSNKILDYIKPDIQFNEELNDRINSSKERER